MKNVHIENGSGEYRELFLSLGFNVVEDDIGGVDLICFTGGEDVSPSFYGEKKHPYTYNNIARDEQEKALFQNAAIMGIPMVGICRGGQFLNVMSGGSMYQHVEGHTREHVITDLESGETVWVTSTHHQMMKPAPEAVLVASSQLGGSREWYEDGVFKKDISDEDIEVVFYPDTKCLCFQPHPEFSGPQRTPMKEYFRKLLTKYLEV